MSSSFSLQPREVVGCRRRVAARRANALGGAIGESSSPAGRSASAADRARSAICLRCVLLAAASKRSRRRSSAGADRGVDAVEEIVQPRRIDAAALQSSSRLTMPSICVCRARGSGASLGKAGDALLDRGEPLRQAASARPAIAERAQPVGYLLQLLREGAELRAQVAARASPAPRAAPASGRGASSSGSHLSARDSCSACADSDCASWSSLRSSPSMSRRAPRRVLRFDRVGEQVDLAA